jgi:hypothetical protein
LAIHRPRAVGAGRVSWRLAANYISYLHAVTIYEHDLGGVVTINEEVGIIGYMVYILEKLKRPPIGMITRGTRRQHLVTR